MWERAACYVVTAGLIAGIVTILFEEQPTQARATPALRSVQAAPMFRTVATWYGPGLYGNAFYCTGKHPAVPNSYGRGVRGVAHMKLPCGTWVTMCFKRCVRVRVIDRGRFKDTRFDATARTAMDLCNCTKPYTMNVRWRRS